MWVFATDGFFNVVHDRNSPTSGEEAGVLVRARWKRDLETLLARRGAAFMAKHPIAHTPRADYPYRVRMTRRDWSALVLALADSIDYDNFKDEVGRRDKARAHAYLDVWAAMREAQEGGA